MAVNVVTAPATMPVSLAEAKEMLLIDHTADDALLTMLIAGATEEAERIARRSFVTRTLDLLLDAWPRDGVIRLEYPPVQTITSITYSNEMNQAATVPGTDYVAVLDVTPPLVMLTPGASWPSVTLRSESPIRVRYTAGYGATEAVPSRYKILILALVSIDYENREGILPSSIAQRRRIEAALQFDIGYAT